MSPGLRDPEQAGGSLGRAGQPWGLGCSGELQWVPGCSGGVQYWDAMVDFGVQWWVLGCRGGAGVQHAAGEGSAGRDGAAWPFSGSTVREHNMAEQRRHEDAVK